MKTFTATLSIVSEKIFILFISLQCSGKSKKDGQWLYCISNIYKMNIFLNYWESSSTCFHLLWVGSNYCTLIYFTFIQVAIGKITCLPQVNCEKAFLSVLMDHEARYTFRFIIDMPWGDTVWVAVIAKMALCLICGPEQWN